MIKRMSERDRLLQAYKEAEGEERARILAKIAVLDDESFTDYKDCIYWGKDRCLGMNCCTIRDCRYSRQYQKWLL